ncbi:DUF4982 domain-containing protein [Eubacteriales bacterium OttesenSCG-928-N13]|nr:DUF4982 domain-containing protein [Eubacteriales bacterium OttesenSCG-928-N13]
MDLTNWKFHLGDAKRHGPIDHGVCYSMTKAGGQLGDMDVFLQQNDWQDVQIPHDWCAALPVAPENDPSNGYKPRGMGWYYTQVPPIQLEQDGIVLLEFEGVMSECQVFVNGSRAVRSFSGYSGFFADITDCLLPNEPTLIAVFVDARNWEGWWYEGAGIYRPVHLITLPSLHMQHLGQFAHAEQSEQGWTVHAQSGVENEAAAPQDFELTVRVLDADGQLLIEQVNPCHVDAFGSAQLNFSMPLASPTLWSPDQPYQYRVEYALTIQGKIIQTCADSLGLRTIEWTSDRGMQLNGQTLPVRGICCHQDHAGVGIAVPRALMEYRITKLKQMGVNAYRCAHNAVSEEFLSVCDALGMLVMVENRHFNTSTEVLAQLDSLVLRARNHPSVFLYSLFNEEHPWQSQSRGLRMVQKMMRRVRRLDDTRPITAAMNGGVLAQENASDALDVAGINYFIFDYMAYNKRRPNHPTVGTENGPIFATRGIYRNDAKLQQYDSYGENFAPFGQRLEDTMEAVIAAPHVAGQFMWGGFDYRGEPQPFEWPSVVSHWGFMDNCGFEKDTFYLLQSYYSDAPMLYLLPHWNWAEGESVRVCAFTNCAEVTLSLNGKRIGTKTVERNRAEWVVPFASGELCAVAEYDGTQLHSCVCTAGMPSALHVCDMTPADAQDALIFNIDLVDAEGVHVPDRDALIHFHVEGGQVWGVGNGDPNGTQSDVAPEIRSFSGRCQLIVRPQADVVTVRAESDGLKGATIEWHRTK